MTILRLANEYLSGPIFCPDEEKMGHVDVEKLPISKSLKSDITDWDDEYQNTFNDNYPPDSGFSSPDLKAAHTRKGRELAKRLQLELGENYLVQYKS